MKKIEDSVDDNVKLMLSSPWSLYYRKINALFGEDPEITIKYIEDKPTIKLYVRNSEKAEALAQILPSEKQFGNVILYINVIPNNKLDESKIAIFKRAFKDNPVLDFVAKAEDKTGVFDNEYYLVFKNKVVQFFNDDIFDFFGVCSTLYENIAEEIFGKVDGIHYCTNITMENAEKYIEDCIKATDKIKKKGKNKVND